MTQAQRILSRLSSALAKHPGSNNAALAGAIGADLDEIETTIQDILQAHALETATGASLDSIAALFDLAREGLSDIDLRSAVGIELSRRQSQGSLADIIDVVTYITGILESEISIIERPLGEPTASFYIVLGAANSRSYVAATLVAGVLRAKAAGVAFLSDQLVLIWTCPEAIALEELGISLHDLIARPWGWGLHPWGTEPWGGHYVVVQEELAEVQII